MSYGKAEVNVFYMENLNNYYNFYMVAKTGSISRAAEKLFVSQPALSKSITRLEESMGVKLFYRNSRGVTLTEEGQIIYSYVERAFDNLSKGEETLRKAGELGIGHIRIGVSTSLCKYILLDYLKDFIHDNPHIKISIDCHATLNTLRLLEQDDIDIGLICNTDIPSHMTYLPVRKIHDIFVANRDYIENLNIREQDENEKAKSNFRFATKEILEKSTLMVLEETNITRTHIDKYLLNEDIRCSQILEIGNMDLLIDFAAIGMGVAAVVREFAESHISSGQIMELPLEHSIPERTVGFVFAESKKSSSVLRKFMDYIG